MDPRISVIDKRFDDTRRIIAVSGGKGGIGKSSTASILALSLVDAGKKVGLLDLDFYGPSCHFILGVDRAYPREEKGVIPPLVSGIRFMSVVYYAKDNPLMARGIDISNSIIEMLAITHWGDLDFLIIDMPPGIGDTTLDVIRLLKKIEFLVVTTSSRVAFKTVKKTLQMLKDSRIPIIGLVENMKIDGSSWLREEVERSGIRYLGDIPFDNGFENCISNPKMLLGSTFAVGIKKLLGYL